MSQFKTHKLTPVTKTQKTPIIEDISNSPDENKKSHKIRNWFIGGILTVTSILFIGTFALRALGDMSLWNMNKEGTLFTPIIPHGEDMQEKIKWTKNLLIAGIWWQWHEWSHLTDSIMLASINQDNGHVTLLSIPRDLFVAYPKWYGTAGKINALYSMGISEKIWIKFLAEKVSEITGQPIDNYIVIDFTWFKSIVDALWGIDIDVPKDLIDREYPDNNWGYEVFRVSAGLQTFDGDTALKYARSRHSTSDFDRSERQQLIMKWIKEKALSIWFLTSPEKISGLFSAIRSHIDTSLTLGEVTDIALGLKDIESKNINIYNLSNECTGNICTPWAYLYTPAREYFGGASVVIPENASATRLSYYESIKRFTAFIYRYPNIRNERAPISIIVGKGKSGQAKLLVSTLSKMGINFDGKETIKELTGAVNTSHINIYWNTDAKVGISEDSTIVQALKFIEEKIPYSLVEKNEYITTDGPRIEIIIGNDSNSYFTFAKPAYYLPYISGEASNIEWTGSGVNISKTGASVISWETTLRKPQNKQQKPIQDNTISPKTEKQPIIKDAVIEISPGEWENF